jgi:steroid 5-alpha reductase family enzyme
VLTMVVQWTLRLTGLLNDRQKSQLGSNWRHEALIKKLDSASYLDKLDLAYDFFS